MNEFESGQNPKEQQAFEATLENEAKKAVKDNDEVPKILVMGHTGAGKSSLINALLDKEAQNTDVVPCTMDSSELDWSAGNTELKLVDVPGFGEADAHEKRVNFIFKHIPESDLALLVVGAPNRACEHEREFLDKVKANEPDFPIILVGNRIDMINPVRKWDPENLNLVQPTTQKEVNIAEWASYIQSACNMKDITLTAAGESYDDYEFQYGLEHLRELIVKRLPEAAQNRAARILFTEELKYKRAMQIIAGATTAAGVAALTPIPFADAGVITGIQAGMIVGIAYLYGFEVDWKQAVGLLGPALGFFAGRTAFQSLIKLIPGIGTAAGAAIGAGVATTATFAIGMTYLHFFIHGNFRPTKEEIIQALRGEYSKASQRKDEFVEQSEAKAAEKEA